MGRGLGEEVSMMHGHGVGGVVDVICGGAGVTRVRHREHEEDDPSGKIKSPGDDRLHDSTGLRRTKSQADLYLDL